MPMAVAVPRSDVCGRSRRCGGRGDRSAGRCGRCGDLLQLARGVRAPGPAAVAMAAGARRRSRGGARLARRGDRPARDRRRRRHDRGRHRSGCRRWRGSDRCRRRSRSRSSRRRCRLGFRPVRHRMRRAVVDANRDSRNHAERRRDRAVQHGRRATRERRDDVRGCRERPAVGGPQPTRLDGRTRKHLGSSVQPLRVQRPALEGQDRVVQRHQSGEDRQQRTEDPERCKNDRSQTMKRGPERFHILAIGTSARDLSAGQQNFTVAFLAHPAKTRPNPHCCGVFWTKGRVSDAARDRPPHRPPGPVRRAPRCPERASP